MKLKLLPLLLVSLLAAGCNLFDEELYKNAASLSDSCGDALDDAPLTGADLIGNELMFDVDTRDLSDTKRQLSTCTGSVLDGPEGFFTVDMTAGERWHFHVTVLSAENDPALYILDDGCDDRACSVGDGIDICQRGTDEHLSFIAPSDGTFVVAIDTSEDIGGVYEVLVARPICGDGEKDHSENCEDGNVIDGDGCDALCRTELGDGASEVEPNDDFTGANRVLGADVATVEIRGVVGSLCDYDVYAIEIPAGATISATMEGIPTACQALDRPSIELVGTDGHTILASGADGANGCEELTGTTPGSAGVYHVRVLPGTATPAFDYDLRLTVTP